MADAVEGMLRGSAEAFRTADRDAAKAVGRMDDVVDRLHRALHAYLARIPRESLGDDDARRLAEIQAFAINLEHAGDIVDRDLARHAAKRARRAIEIGAEGAAEVGAMHEELIRQLRLAVAVFMLEDMDAARRLVREKESLREAEARAARRLTAAGERPEDEGGVAGLLLDVSRDVKRVGAHLAATAQAKIDRPFHIHCLA